MRGIDVSHYQGKIDWKKVKESGVDFAIQKCTEGTGFIDKTYSTNKKGARENCILFGSYHFAGGQNATKEAEHYLRNIGDMQEGELLVLDFEINIPDPVGWCKEFLSKIYTETGIRPFLYTFEYKVRGIDWGSIATRYPLWEAKHGTNDGNMQKEPHPGLWKEWTIWQYTSKDYIPGIVGHVDSDYTKKTLEELKKYGKQAQETPGIPVEKFLVHPIKEVPTDPVYITQHFGENSDIYRRFGMQGHNGIDYRTRFWDSPFGHRYIVAAKEGKVIEAKWDNGYGNYIRLEHDLDGSGNEQTIYGHLKKFYVKVGQTVKQGQRIGLSNNTGFSTGPHLHWGYRPKGWKKIYNNGFKGYVDQERFIKD